jgi:aminopeptidase N
MLRRLVGTDTFWTAIRTYYARYRERNASTDDLRRVFEEASGMELMWFFDQWLHRAGHPQLRATWQYDASRKVVLLDIEQLQQGEAYRLLLDVALVPGTAATLRREQVEVRERRQHVEIRADAEPSALVLDPDTWSLIEATIIKR